MLASFRQADPVHRMDVRTLLNHLILWTSYSLSPAH